MILRKMTVILLFLTSANAHAGHDNGPVMPQGKDLKESVEGQKSFFDAKVIVPALTVCALASYFGLRRFRSNYNTPTPAAEISTKKNDPAGGIPQYKHVVTYHDPKPPQGVYYMSPHVDMREEIIPMNNEQKIAMAIRERDFSAFSSLFPSVKGAAFENTFTLTEFGRSPLSFALHRALQDKRQALYQKYAAKMTDFNARKKLVMQDLTSYVESGEILTEDHFVKSLLEANSPFFISTSDPTLNSIHYFAGRRKTEGWGNSMYESGLTNLLFKIPGIKEEIGKMSQSEKDTALASAKEGENDYVADLLCQYDAQ